MIQETSVVHSHLCSISKMTISIKFYSKSEFRCIKINNKCTDTILLAKFTPFYLPTFQFFSDNHLREWHIVTEVTLKNFFLQRSRDQISATVECLQYPGTGPFPLEHYIF